MQNKWVATNQISGIIGVCGGREVFLGFANADVLYRNSFADVLNEDTGQGYQRRFSEAHSLEFRKYIKKPRATTIPLTFNLRPSKPAAWRLVRGTGAHATLQLNDTSGKALAQVDCQHRLGFLSDVDVPLAFMTYIGLTTREEMEVFSVINSKAKGLNSSLLDFHESKLTEDLSAAKPEIYIALRLHESPDSPWHRALDLGGTRTVGMRRYASLRTMQKAVRRFLRTNQILQKSNIDEACQVVLEFWRAVRVVLSDEWQEPRRHFVTKGVGVYALMSIASDLYLDAQVRNVPATETYFIGTLSDFVNDLDWSTKGPLRGFGGASGADQALELLRDIRKGKQLKAIRHG